MVGLNDYKVNAIVNGANGLRMLRAAWVVMLVVSLSGCAVIAVADAAVTTVATGVKLTVKAVGAVADAVIPDGDDKSDGK
jgi:hypothetical protein